MDEKAMPKIYDAKQHEDAIYKAWTQSGYFTPENLPDADQRKEAFTIMLPPPNVTGTLHMGHAVMLAIEDAMVRFARMRGKKALWLPGTDHAAVATEAKVEKLLIDEEGMEKPKQELGREAFLNRVSRFAQESHDTIVNQMKKMGASVDWSREAYTLDDDRNLAVRTAFKKMYDDGLIYRGYRVINWSVKGQSTCSDDELVYVERPGKLYTFKYSKHVPIPISTTRPETKLGDTAIAVHPDGKWKDYIGQTFEVDSFGQDGHKLTLKVFGDEAVDDDFGTGALGVTSAHSPIDFEMYQKQKAAGNDIGLIQVIGEDGKMTQEAGSEYAGRSVEEAREQVVAWLAAQGLLEGSEDITQSVGTSDRFKDVVEPLPKTQWFVDVNKEFVQEGKQVTLKKLMQEAVRGGDIEILPERFHKTYFHWIDNLRDWNISRQIWFGHQVPVWYKGEEIFVGLEAPEGEGWEQDPDTLDTWFSAGLWTFSTLGWPEQTEELKTFHPTDVLETGYDILFFWVARMILMSTYLLGEVPFKTVYLHGLVRDEKGRKMSKSLGNIIDPLQMIQQYGADATRLSLMIGSSPGNDTKLSEEKVASYRNFTNKLWNISRFVFLTVEKVEKVEKVEAKTLADRWILGRLADVVEKVTTHHEKYELSLAGELLRDFTWNEFADWYVEIAKTQPSDNTNKVLLYVLQTVLKLWHPFMPFVTEEIYKQFDDGMLMVADWPEATHVLSKENAETFAALQRIVTKARDYRQALNLPKGELIGVVTSGEALQDSEPALMQLGGLGRVAFEEGDGVPALRFELSDELRQTVKEKMQSELEQLNAYKASLEKRLVNTEYVQNAPKDVVQSTRDELEKTRERVTLLSDELNTL